MIAGESLGERIFHILNYIFLVLLGLIFAVPFYLVLIASFTSPESYDFYGYQFWPRRPVDDFGNAIVGSKAFSLEGYEFVFRPEQHFWAHMKSSLIITISATLVSVLGTSMVAYTLSKRELVGRAVFMNIIVFAMLFGGGTIPGYVLMVKLGMRDNYLAFILPGILSIWNMILIRSFFYTISPAIEEAAKIDGCRHFRIYATIFMPLSMPILATVTLFTALGSWNNWMGPMLYISEGKKDEMLPLIAWMRELVTNAQGSESSSGSNIGPVMQMSAVIISIVPIMSVYPFLQKYFVKGIMLGSVKG